MSLISVAMPIWNEIAETQELATEWARKAFRLNQEQAAEAYDREHQTLVDEGADPEVATAFLEVFPLLAERKAIARFLRTRPDLKGVLPEVTTANEAVMLASMDRPLNLSQQKQLQRLLQSRLT